MDWRHLGEALAAGNEVYTELKNLVVWAKTNAGQGSFYRSQHEHILVFKNGDGPYQTILSLVGTGVTLERLDLCWRQYVSRRSNR